MFTFVKFGETIHCGGFVGFGDSPTMIFSPFTRLISLPFAIPFPAPANFRELAHTESALDRVSMRQHGKIRWGVGWTWRDPAMRQHTVVHQRGDH